MIKRKFSSTGSVVRVTFELPSDAAKEGVHVVGSFNDWDESATPMKYIKTRDVWKTGISLSPGESHEFRYLIDGATWRNEEEADRYVTNPFAGENSVIDL